MNRRRFLSLVGVGLASNFFGQSQTPTQTSHTLETIVYQGANLAGWTVIVGDGIRGTVTLDDIETAHFSQYSEVRANIQSRPDIMAHNLTFNKISDDTAFNYVHICEYQFRLPYLPSTNNPDFNGQTVEGGISLWNGITRLNYSVGFQWIVNPYWMTGVVQCWTPRLWQPIGMIPLDTEWHSIKMIIDYQRETTSIQIDGEHYPSCFTKQVGPSDWGTEIASWIASEAISIDPGNNFTGGQTHKAQFKNWIWAWEPANVSQVFLPLIQG